MHIRNRLKEPGHTLDDRAKILKANPILLQCLRNLLKCLLGYNSVTAQGHNGLTYIQQNAICFFRR